MKSERIVYLDQLRILCALAVVGNHIAITQPNNYGLDQLGTFNYTVLTSAWTLVQWPVPVFLMISGNLLLNSKSIHLLKIKKYLFRMITVLLIFGPVYAFFELFFSNHTVTIDMIPTAFLYTLEEKSWGHLWYIYVLIGIYLFLIPLKKIISNIDKKEAIFLLVVLFIGNFLLPTINAIFGLTLYTFMVLSKWVTYFLFGYYIEKVPRFKLRFYVFAFGIASVTKILAQVISVNLLGTDAIIIRNDELLSCIQAIAVYNIFYHYFNRKKLPPPIIID
jgi:surface polysaccharide O-acyltransferase-like enzyme